MAERPISDPRIDTVPPPPDLTPYIVKTGTQYITGGSFVDVYRCRYDDGSKQQEVAVKALRFKCTLDDDTENKSAQMLRKELGIWKGLNHNNIVPFLGVAYGFGMSGAMSLVSLWMPNETLHKFLAMHDSKLDTVRRLQILHDISSGLHYLHSFPTPIVHGDLNPNNVLLDVDDTARLANFGHVSLMKNIPEALHYLQKSTSRSGALRWIAPEQIDPKGAHDRTTKSDIYSLGCIVFSGKEPWSEVREDASVIRHVLLGHKPGRPESRTMNDSHWDLIQRCWLPLQDRPAVDATLYSIQQLLADCLPSSPTSSISQRPSEIHGHRPAPFDVNMAGEDMSSTPLSALATARNIERLQDVEYPEGVRSPREDLNRDAKDGKFRYDREFLMQFMVVCKVKPPNLPPLDMLGIQPMDHSASGVTRGGSGRHRQPSSAMTPAARQGTVGLGTTGSIGTKPGPAPGPFAMGQFSTPTNTLTSEERSQLSTDTRSASVSSSSVTLPFGRPATTRTIPQKDEGEHSTSKKRTRTKRGDKRTEANKAALFQQAEPNFGAPGPLPLGATLEPISPLEMSVNRWITAGTVYQPEATDPESPEVVDRKVRSLLNKLTMEKFDSISDQIISWANKSEKEKDGRTLIQVIRLIFEGVTDEAQCSEMYARLCRKMMEEISPEVQDDGSRNSEGKPISGGQLFRKYLLNRCHDDFERGWVVGVTSGLAEAFDNQAINAANERKDNGSELHPHEYYAAQKAKHRRLGLIKFIGELFKLQMLTERIMHECVKKLLTGVENPEEEKVESLCLLLKTVGQLLDVPKARAHMDVYFARMKELGKNPDVSPRMQFMLQDVIELRDRKWQARGAVVTPTSIAGVNGAITKEKAAAETRTYRQLSLSKGSRRGGDRNAESGPDGAATAGGSVTRSHPKAGDLSQFGKISKAAPMIMGPSSVFIKKDGAQDSLPRKSSKSNMFSMLNQKPEVPVDATRPPGHKPPVDPQRKKLRLLPRGKPTPAPKAPIQIPEPDVHSPNLPEEHRHHINDSLMVTAL